MTARGLSRGLGLLLVAGAARVAPAQTPPAAVAPPRSAATPPPATPSPPPAPPPARPTPAPELAALAPLEGSWRCEGTTPAGPFGPEQSYKATLKVKKDLGDFWYSVDYEQKKTKHGPPPVKMRGFIGYDTAAKRFVTTSADSMGGWATVTAAGWQAGKLLFTGEMSAMGQRIQFRETYTKKSDREIVAVGELKMGKDWITLGNDDCRR
jgi:hypothetical protein